MRTKTLLTVFCTAVLIGCEPVSEPELNVSDPSFAVDPVLGSAFGSGNVTRPDWVVSPGGWRTFAFHAKQYADLTAEGQFEYNDKYMDVDGTEVLVRGIGRVTCMNIVGNTAWVGGIFTQHSLPDRVGLATRFRVKDTGVGRAPPDSISFIYPGGNPQNFCSTTPDWARLVKVEAGSIVVKGG